MAVIWEYPPHIMAELQNPVPIGEREKSRRELSERHSATLRRIDNRISAALALAAEKKAALDWCRANGNPHLAKENAHEI